MSYDTILLIHLPFVILWLICLLLSLTCAGISWLQASRGLSTGSIAVVRFTTLLAVPFAAGVLISGVLLFATGDAVGTVAEGAAGSVVLLIVTIPGTALVFSAARKLITAGVGSGEAITYARRVVMVSGVQFLVILFAASRGFQATGKL